MLDGILRERGPRLNVRSLGWQRTGEMNTPGRSGIDRRDAVNATLRLLRLGEAQWGPAGPGSGPSVQPALDLELDEAWPVLLVALAGCGGLVALSYVVYAAPALLAEVALDAALVGTIYRRLRKSDQRYWLETAVRRTWVLHRGWS